MADRFETAEFWCHDCAESSRFEIVTAGTAAAPREWACTLCGAGYIEAFDVASQIEAEIRVVA
jgi:hypothetical protein